MKGVSLNITATHKQKLWSAIWHSQNVNYVGTYFLFRPQSFQKILSDLLTKIKPHCHVLDWRFAKNKDILCPETHKSLFHNQMFCQISFA